MKVCATGFVCLLFQVLFLFSLSILINAPGKSTRRAKLLTIAAKENSEDMVSVAEVDETT